MSEAVETIGRVSVAPNGKIICHIDGALTHSVAQHIKDKYSDEWTIEKYQEKFPNEPLLSEFATKKLNEIRVSKAASATSMANLATGVVNGKTIIAKQAAFHEVFDLGKSAATMNERTGAAIPITIYQDHNTTDMQLIPDKDENYVFDIDLTKTVIIALELNYPMMAWGYHGTGKTTLFEQVSARTGRPFMRVQTGNMEESNVIGQYVVRNVGGMAVTEFQLGPLPTAMIKGYVYCADEYDFGNPAVLSVYQPVLEGKPLMIKDAPPELRIIRPHPNFRFVATGNTNGSGDETGLYQGTQMQNAANYSRFRITEEVGYMSKKLETAVVSGQSGIEKKEAEKLVEFAGYVREAFKAGKIGTTISPRELIGAGLLGRVRGGKFRVGLGFAFINRLSRSDKEAVNQIAQRIFG